ncbi:MAG: insulinase family protein [Saprospiraceae bacterium]|nr:insulinase family protein [Pyrinomonadaceae bacterium]
MTQAIRKTAPDALAPVPFNIPQPYKTSMPNGLKIVIFQDKRLPLVSYRLAFFSGDVNDPQDAVGMTSAITSMLNEGTENYSSQALAEKVERLGAGLGASSSDDFTIISASALALYDTEILELMAEIIFRPTFPEDELDLYKRNTIENLKFQRSQPNFLAGEQIARLLYGEHPYARVSTTAEDIEKLERDALIAFHKKVFVPDNAVFVAVGDVDRNELVKQIEDHFGDWEAGETAQSTFPAPPERTERTITIVDRQGSAQSNIVLANIGMDRANPDYFAAVVMNQVLGAGASSRVFMNLREEKGYTYGAYTRLDAKKLAGDFEATAEVRTPVTGDSLKEFFYELDRIRADKVSEDELADAKNFLTGVFPIRAETQEGLTGLLVNQQLYSLPEDYLQTYRDKVDAVTAADILRVAAKYIQPEKMAIVIVGDAEDILPQAGPYAAMIEIFDTNGQPKDIAVYGKTIGEETADVSGKWKLVLDFQGQNLPVSLTLVQNGEAVSGKLETMLGDGKIAEGKVRGVNLSATANAEIQGQSVEFVINGSVDGDSMNGTISAPIVPEPLNFTGTRG